MITNWQEPSIATVFDQYDDYVEALLGYDFLIKKIDPAGEKKLILDYGCGPGKVANRLANNLNCKIIAVDTSIYMIELAQNKRANPNIEYHHISSSELDFVQPNSMDYATLCFVLINVSSKLTFAEIIKATYKALKNKGRLFILDTNPNSTGIPFTTFQNGASGYNYADGQTRVERLKIKNSSELVLHDYHWSQSTYQEVLNTAGFSKVVIHEPTLSDIPINTANQYFPIHANEWKHPPFLLLEAIK